MRCPADQDLHPVILQARGQSGHTLKSVKVVYVENHFPKEQLLVSLQLIAAVMLIDAVCGWLRGRVIGQESLRAL